MKKRRKLSNMLVIAEIMRDSLLSKAAKLTGVAIACHRNLKTLTCCPSQHTLSMATGTDVKTIRKGTLELIDKKYLITTRDRALNAQWEHSQYYFLRDWAAQRALVASTDFQGDRMLFAAAGGWLNTVNGENAPTNSIINA